MTDQLSLLYVESDKLLVNHSALGELGLEREALACYYQYIAFISEEEFHYEERILLESDGVDLSEHYNSIYVTCYTSDDRQIYRNILMYVPQLRDIKQLEDAEKYSVIVLIFDSLSKQMFLR